MLLSWICLFVALAVERNSASVIHNIEDPTNTNIGNRSVSLRKVFRRDSKCPEGEYPGNKFCCMNCAVGTRVENDCQEEHEKPTCIPCTDGKDYMDKANGYHECLLCRLCDQEHGEEVNFPCTVSRNTVCKCRASYFCRTNSSQDPRSCDHCQQCTQCENGVAERCTETTDAVCKGYRYYWALLILLPLIVLAVCAVFKFVKCMSNTSVRYQPPPLSEPPTPPLEPYPSYLKDIDLEPYLQDLAGEMFYEQMVQCVRRMCLGDPTIDDIKNNHGQGSEGKYQLLRSWYTQHGQQGAFQKLIESLRECGLNRPAENIINILNSKVPH
ncbi:tumor necrosis factor receptor superfamily member 6 isoform X2 [Xenopus laevis]|uniref:Tumor necrosis factor receptor superfamily member 6 n=1 Tax=Xenopus laevis TaxID=8355 RepID=A0A8J1LBC7_XENLA|nr:tumor necrosis factor receptor superfamily member 6 isoform X2 [Xenopus laevis]